MQTFIDELSQGDISAQVAADFACIKSEIFGDRNWDHVKGHIGRIAGTKLIGANLDIECDNNILYGSTDEYLQDYMDCCNALDIDIPMQSAVESSGSFSTRLMMRILLKIAEESGVEDWINNLIRSWID